MYRTVGGEVDGDDSRHFSERGLVVISEKRTPPFAGTVFEITGSASAGNGFMAHAVRSVYRFRHGYHTAVTSLIRVGCRQIIDTVTFEEKSSFAADVFTIPPGKAWCDGIVSGSINTGFTGSSASPLISSFIRAM